MEGPDSVTFGHDANPNTFQPAKLSSFEPALRLSKGIGMDERKEDLDPQENSEEPGGASGAGHERERKTRPVEAESSVREGPERS